MEPYSAVRAIACVKNSLSPSLPPFVSSITFYLINIPHTQKKAAPQAPGFSVSGEEALDPGLGTHEPINVSLGKGKREGPCRTLLGVKEMTEMFRDNRTEL